MKANFLLIPVFLVFASCANLVSNFDQNSYNSAKTLKVESLALVSKYGDEAEHSMEIAELQSKLNAQLAYEEGKGKSNNLSYQQWKILVSTDSDLLGRFLKEWNDGKRFTLPFVKEKSDQIGQAYDQILRFEGGKQK